MASDACTMKYVKTDVGQLAFKDRSPFFSSRQRSAFILFDGVKTLDEVMAAVSALGVTPADIDHLVAQGFLTEVEETKPMSL
jgi:hypothetical protein